MKLKVLRKLLPPIQHSACMGCGRAMVERKRRPCPTCGSLNRSIHTASEDYMGFEDRA